MTEETKNQAFKRILATRLPKATKAVELIGNLSSNNYECDEEEARKVIQDILKPLQIVAKDLGVPFLVYDDGDSPQPSAPRAKAIAADADHKAIEFKQWTLVDEAINAITDGKPDEARKLLMEAMST